MLFLALTAEEKGLLGAYHFAAGPTVPRESLVANVNMDMPLLIGDVSDVVPIGIEHSTLESVVRRAVAEADHPQRAFAPGWRTAGYSSRSPGVGGRRGMVCCGNGPVSAPRNAAMSPTSASVSDLFNCVEAMTRTASGSVFTAPLCM